MAVVEPAFKGQPGWRRVYPDLPGLGRSAGTPRIRSMDDYLEVVVEFIDRVSGGGRFAIGGSSFGAYLALGVARKRTSRLDGILLSVPEINHSPLEDRRDAAFGTPGPSMRLHPVPGLPEYVEDTPWLQSLPFRDLGLPLYQSPKPVQAPSLFLLGRQDAPFRFRKYWQLLPRFPRATFAVLDGATHALWADRPELAVALVRDWIVRVEAASRPRRHG